MACSLRSGRLLWTPRNSTRKEGIVLYFTSPGGKLNKYLLFSLKPVNPFKKRIKVVRKLFGRKEKGYLENGLVSKYPGQILSPRNFLISAEGLKETTSFLTKEKVNFCFEEIWK